MPTRCSGFGTSAASSLDEHRDAGLAFRQDRGPDVGATRRMVTFKSVPFKRALPDADCREGRVFRTLAETLSVPGMSRDEVQQEMITLASTLARATYHRRQFAWTVSEARSRYEAHKPQIVFDQIAKYVAFEAAAFLSAARSFIDGVFHVARRRAGVALEDVEDTPLWQALTNPKSDAYALPEIAVFARRSLGTTG